MSAIALRVRRASMPAALSIHIVDLELDLPFPSKRPVRPPKPRWDRHPAESDLSTVREELDPDSSWDHTPLREMYADGRAWDGTSLGVREADLNATLWSVRRELALASGDAFLPPPGPPGPEPAPTRPAELARLLRLLQLGSIRLARLSAARLAAPAAAPPGLPAARMEEELRRAVDRSVRREAEREQRATAAAAIDAGALAEALAAAAAADGAPPDAEEVARLTDEILRFKARLAGLPSPPAADPAAPSALLLPPASGGARGAPVSPTPPARPPLSPNPPTGPLTPHPPAGAHGPQPALARRRFSADGLSPPPRPPPAAPLELDLPLPPPSRPPGPPPATPGGALADALRRAAGPSPCPAAFLNAFPAAPPPPPTPAAPPPPSQPDATVEYEALDGSGSWGPAPPPDADPPRGSPSTALAAAVAIAGEFIFRVLEAGSAVPPPSGPLLAPARPRVLLEGPLPGAAGAHGTVFRGRWGDRPVAVKRVAVSGPRMLRAARLEIAALRRLAHPHVVRYHGAASGGEGDAAHVDIVMELVDGPSLADELARSGALPEPVAARACGQLLAALAYLHGHSVLHRDVKPANVVRRPGGDVCLLDFSVSAVLDVPAGQRRSCVGTPWYTAPEVVRLEAYAHGADVWSLGAALLELLTARRPYADLGPVQAMMRIAEGGPPPLPPGLSPAAAAFLAACLTPDPAQRPSAEALLRHPFVLAAAAEPGEGPAAPAEPGCSAP